MNIAVVIPSRNRPECCERLRTALPFAWMCVSETDAPHYDWPKDRMRVHPDDVIGMARKRQWIHDNFTEEVCIQIDDDFRYVLSKVGKHCRKIDDPGAVWDILENSAWIAKGIKAPAFGYSLVGNPMSFTPHSPFSFNVMLSQVCGVVGRDVHYDPAIQVHGEDLDFTLRCLLEKRIIWIDDRFRFDCGQVWKGRGGLQDLRTTEKETADFNLIRSRWGNYIKVKNKKSVQCHNVNVRRRW